MNRRGSYMAEAAIVLPIIVLATITVVLIVLFFYEESVMQSRLHMILRAEAGAVSGKTLCSTACDEDPRATISVSGVLTKKVSGNQYLHMRNAGILRKKGSFKIDGEVYVADGVAFLRWRP